MKTMCDTNDGFKIAEVDLELRGPGDIAGTQQSGVVNLHIASLSKDRKIMEVAHQAASEILDKDEQLSLPEHAVMVEQLRKIEEANANYSRIS